MAQFVNLYLVKRWGPTCALVVAACLFTGCVSSSYRYGTESLSVQTDPIRSESSNPIKLGQDNDAIDRIESAVQAPRRWVAKIRGLPVSSTEEIVQRNQQAAKLSQEYLSVNGLHDVNIDIRVYDPVDQWRRLQANQHIRPVWKATGGTLSWLRYTLLPLRAFHSDHYDPFTNTLNLNSTTELNALYESALAKEYRMHPRIGVGTYAIFQYAPLVPLVHHAQASSDVLTYCEHHLDGELTDELYPLTHSRIGSLALSEAFSVVSLYPKFNAPIYTKPILQVAGSSAGHSTGKLLAWNRSATKEEPTESAGSSRVVGSMEVGPPLPPAK